jgi:hypothetical protein
MTSRRLIASSEAKDLPMMRLQQGLATGGMGHRGQFARQQPRAAHVRFGSITDIETCQRDVRFTPNSGHCRTRLDVRFVPKADVSSDWKLVAPADCRPT